MIKPYVLLAEQFGYKVEFVEPESTENFPIKFPDGKWNYEFLKGRNTHGVPDANVQKMIDEYEYDPTIEKIINS